MADRAAISEPGESLSHNLLGQRLGRKGRGTRERILAATERLLDSDLGTPISLSSVAREASLGMTSLYAYFGDLTELLLAVLEPIAASAEASHIGMMRTRWPDETLGADCRRFVAAFHAFWEQHSRILHLRNSFADAGDKRMGEHRLDVATPLVALITAQMDGTREATAEGVGSMATVLTTGLERTITVVTDLRYMQLRPADGGAYARGIVAAEARLLELGLREGRAISAGERMLA